MRLIKKFFFVMRYLRARLMHRGLKMTGFVFFEPDVSFKIEDGGIDSHSPRPEFCC